MPMYEYECPECGRFEVLQKFSDKPLTKCPNCEEHGKKSKITKVVSQSAFHLKGSGWYKTDYSSGGSSTSTTSKSKSESTSTSSTESSTKSEAKSDGEKKPGVKACGGGCSCH